jgi:hypothetical protein
VASSVKYAIRRGRYRRIDKWIAYANSVVVVEE